MLRCSVYETLILDALADVQSRRSELIDPGANVYEEYGINQSFQRGSMTRARNLNVSRLDIDVIIAVSKVAVLYLTMIFV